MVGTKVYRVAFSDLILGTPLVLNALCHQLTLKMNGFRPFWRFQRPRCVCLNYIYLTIHSLQKCHCHIFCAKLASPPIIFLKILCTHLVAGSCLAYGYTRAKKWEKITFFLLTPSDALREHSQQIAYIHADLFIYYWYVHYTLKGCSCHVFLSQYCKWAVCQAAPFFFPDDNPAIKHVLLMLCKLMKCCK